MKHDHNMFLNLLGSYSMKRVFFPHLGSSGTLFYSFLLVVAVVCLSSARVRKRYLRREEVLPVEHGGRSVWSNVHICTHVGHSTRAFSKGGVYSYFQVCFIALRSGDL